MDEINSRHLKRHSSRQTEEKYNNQSKEKLLNSIKQKFDTTIIGSLAIFEKTFGHLWGHGKNIKDLTEEEYNNRMLWDNARKELLDAGHSNSRAAKSEIQNYTISWNRFTMHFKIKEQG